jgi:hypothetical protein
LLEEETYRIARDDLKTYSDPAFCRVLLLFRAWEQGIPPAPGAYTDQNPDLLLCFVALGNGRARREREIAEAQQREAERNRRRWTRR